MKLSRNLWLFALVILIGVSTTVIADQIRLVQGRRPLKEKITFTVDILHDKNERPGSRTAPDDIQIYLVLADRPASGFVFLDGKAVGRFDETLQFLSNPADVSYGRHTIMVTVANPALLGNVNVIVRGGTVREIIDDEEATTTSSRGEAVSTSPRLEDRVVELERKVRELETEVATLKKKKG